MSDLRGKTALVTGGSRGIGRAIAERLARDGATVAVHYGKGEQAARETVDAIRAEGGSAFPVQALLGEPGDAEGLWAAFDNAVEPEAGRLGVDIVVNNAGITTRGGIGDATPEKFDEAFAVDVRAPFFIVQAGLGRIRDGGRIINLSTALTHLSRPSTIIYGMAKGAVDVLTLNLAQELGSRGITVNAVAPGIVATDINSDWLGSNAEARAHTAGLTALGRVGAPPEIADVVSFFAGDDARWVTGQYLEVSGGLRM